MIIVYNKSLEKNVLKSLLFRHSLSLSSNMSGLEVVVIDDDPILNKDKNAHMLRSDHRELRYS